MKKVFMFFAVIMLCVATISCSNENSKGDMPSSVVVKSNLSRSQIIQLADTIDKSFEAKSRADGSVSITEEEAMLLMQPLVEDGRQIQISMLQQLRSGSNSELIAEISSMSNEELAIMSFLVTTVTGGFEPDNNSQAEQTIEFDDILPCLTVAVGISDLSSTWAAITCAGAVNATTLVPLVKVIAKHYVSGYLGAALFVYSVVDCLETTGVIDIW